jgi:hypothetical protein
LASPQIWLQLLATIKAVAESVTSTIDVGTNINRYLSDSETIQESRRISRVFSTYSDDEVNAIARRLDECRRRFIAEGDGEQRRKCMCNALTDLKAGNGGQLPHADHWYEYWEQLRCD